MKTSLAFLTFLAAMTSANAYSYLRLAASNLAGEIASNQGELVLGISDRSLDQRFETIVGGKSQPVVIRPRSLPLNLEVTYDSPTPTAFLEEPNTSNKYQQWLIGGAQAGQIRNLGREGDCLAAAGWNAGDDVVMALCDCNDPRQAWVYGESVEARAGWKRGGGASGAEVVARAVAERDA